MADFRFAISNQSDVEQLISKIRTKELKYFESNTDLDESLAELDDNWENIMNN